ncbi:hypothetical protein WG906_04405 [Pedobacter sp. P351]|uniref:hypothetical protein n=1 Tax=Pedobacter superstes TaxID=3133441 RepID=UPI0030A6CB60
MEQTLFEVAEVVKINLNGKYQYKKGEFEKHIFKLGDDEQIDIMMKLQLRN